ncbi:MAG: hypothetical protein HYY84_13965 [Deltaproteobacteria bacterium]|nr:hypothetical protein [Deltaproteobacteria bacterium]
MDRATPVVTRIAGALTIATAAFLGWAAIAIDLDYYDTYDLIVSSWHLWGEPNTISYPKNFFAVAFFALLFAPFRFAGAYPDLIVYHGATFLLHLALLVVTALWIRRRLPTLPLTILIGVIAWNRLFIHFAPFAMPDLASALAVALWFWDTEREKEIRWRQLILRALILAFCALGRPQVALIPIVSLIVGVVRPPQGTRLRAARNAAAASFGGLALYALATGTLLALEKGVDFFSGLVEVVRILIGYWDAVHASSQPPLIVFSFIWESLTPAGVVLIAIGAVEFLRRRPTLPVAGPFVGGLVFLGFLFVPGYVEARYLIPLLPIFALAQGFGLASLHRVRPVAAVLAALVLFAGVVPEMARLTDPFYRSDHHGKTARAIATKNPAAPVTLLGTMHAFYPRERNFHEQDTTFYIYDFGAPAQIFYTRQKISIHWGRMTFRRYGLPIPDDVESIAAPGVTMVLVKTWLYPGKEAPNEILPIYALRWFPRDPATNGTCDPRATHICVETWIPFQGTLPP